MDILEKAELTASVCHILKSWIRLIEKREEEDWQFQRVMHFTQIQLENSSMDI